jgi:hypothetical protein
MSDRFNEGLEQGISLGILKERERIIKILMDYAPHLTTSGLMELIKGEQK